MVMPLNTKPVAKWWDVQSGLDKLYSGHASGKVMQYVETGMDNMAIQQDPKPKQLAKSGLGKP